MREYIELGSAPCGEVCAQVGETDYATKAYAECEAFRVLIRKKLGNEPEGAKLAIKGFSHDFGRYYELVCYYDETIPLSVDYAFKCENDLPLQWDKPFPCSSLASPLRGFSRWVKSP